VAPVRVKKTRQCKWTADFTMAPAKPRLTTPAEAAILAKRMSEVLTGEIVIRGLDPRIHQSSKKPFLNDGLPGQARQ
jgi:hypothetical protein